MGGMGNGEGEGSIFFRFRLVYIKVASNSEFDRIPNILVHEEFSNTE